MVCMRCVRLIHYFRLIQRGSASDQYDIATEYTESSRIIIFRVFPCIPWLLKFYSFKITLPGFTGSAHSQLLQQLFMYTAKATITHDHQPVTGMCLLYDRGYQFIDCIRDDQRYRQAGGDFAYIP